MGRVSIFSIDGLDLWFNSSDHEPPHFHASKPGWWEVRVYILELKLEIKWRRRRVSGAVVRTLLELTQQHQAKLLKEWEEKVDC